MEDIIRSLKVLVPIAKAVPVLGSRVEGSLEAAIHILEMVQVRSPACSLRRISNLS
jgi:hypothetical protein